ncbi:hypothetical protein KUCAC02_000727, partial [Chaenocephalus aceratus]
NRTAPFTGRTPASKAAPPAGTNSCPPVLKTHPPRARADRQRSHRSLSGANSVDLGIYWERCVEKQRIAPHHDVDPRESPSVTHFPKLTTISSPLTPSHLTARRGMPQVTAGAAYAGGRCCHKHWAPPERWEAAPGLPQPINRGHLSLPIRFAFFCLSLRHSLSEMAPHSTPLWALGS